MKKELEVLDWFYIAYKDKKEYTDIKIPKGTKYIRTYVQSFSELMGKPKNKRYIRVFKFIGTK